MQRHPLARSLSLLALAALTPAPVHAQNTISNLAQPPDLLVSQVSFAIDAKAEDVKVCGFRFRNNVGFSDACADDTVPIYSSFRAWVGPADADAEDASQWSPIGLGLGGSDRGYYVDLDITPITISAGTSRRFSIAGLFNEDDVSGPAAKQPKLDAIEVAFVDTFENDDLTVVSGESQTAPEFFSGPTTSAQFHGQVRYALGTESCGGLDLPVVTLPSTLYDGPEAGGVGPLQNGSVYVVSPGTFGWAEVPTGKTLTVEPGAILKFGNGSEAASRLNVRGTADFRGTTATSVYDDEAGGDTDGELGLAPRSAEPGDFEGIRFEFTSENSSWQGGELRYAGSNGGLSALSANDGELLLQGVTFRDNAAGPGHTVDFEEEGQPLVTENVFVDNEGTPIAGVTFDMLDGFFGNVAQDNLSGDYLTITGSTTGCFGSPLAEVTEDILVNAGSYTGCALVVDGTACVTSAGSLTFANGTNVKFVPDRNGGIEVQDGGLLTIDGTGAVTVSFGALGNDSFAGDTDKDGVDTAQPGDWRGVRFFPFAQGFLSHVSFADAGDTTPTLDIQSSSVTADSIFVRDGNDDGIRISSLDGDLTNSLSVGNNGAGFVLPTNDPDGIEPDLLHATAVDNVGDGVRGISGPLGGEIRNSILWNNGDNFGDDIVVSQVFTSIGGFDGVNGNLDSDPMLDPEFLPIDPSPAIDAGEGLFPILNTDFLDGTRFGGTSETPDIGAKETSTSILTGDSLVIGDTSTLTTVSSSSPGAPVAYFGGLPVGVHLPGFGLVGVDLTSAVFLGIAGEGQSLDVPVPDAPALEGASIGTQGFLFDAGAFAPTNALIGSIANESPLFLD